MLSEESIVIVIIQEGVIKFLPRAVAMGIDSSGLVEVGSPYLVTAWMQTLSRCRKSLCCFQPK